MTSCKARTRRKWTAEQDDVILEYWARRWSAGMIAQQVGMTRSAVLGRLYRLGVLGKPRDQRAPRERFPNAPPTPKGRGAWTEESLTEKWADRKERLRREREQSLTA